MAKLRSDVIILGTRGSELALAQTSMVEHALRRAWPELEIAKQVIRTSGDEGARAVPIVDRQAGRKGMFTREIEKELLAGRIDVAVHSAKDLPSEMRDELEVRATLPRGQTDDVLIAKNGAGLTSIPARSVIATGSVRRQHQLRWKRPDVEIAEIRGNVPTRLRKLRENAHWAAIILARAGLDRLGIKLEMEILSQDDFVPAGGQGIIALQLRRDDQSTHRLVDAINHEPTHICLRAEREFLRLLEGDCDSPVGVHASYANGALQLRAQIFEEETAAPRAGIASGLPGAPETLAATLMKQIYGN